MCRLIHPNITTPSQYTLSIPQTLTHPVYIAPAFLSAGADGAVNRAGEKDDAQTKQLDAKLGTDGNSNDNNKSLLHTEASESKSSGTTTLVNDSISEVNEGDEAAFELSPGLEKFFAKPAMDYVVDFYDAFSNIDDGGVAIMMEYMDGGTHLASITINNSYCTPPDTPYNISTLSNIRYQD